MPTLSERFDKILVNLAWSLWTELGVAGVHQKHQQYLILPEELILLTTVIAEKDPRLRDEALDWCSRYHHFISLSRLRSLSKALGERVCELFSIFAATLNSIAHTNWPLFVLASPIKFSPSGKSKLPSFESPALLCFRLRALFGVGARADLITFCLLQEDRDFAVSDITEIGYTKRNFATVLEDFARAEIFDVSLLRNQKRYSFVKRDLFIQISAPLPKFFPSWRLILDVVFTLRDCIHRVEGKSDSTKAIEIRNTLLNLKDKLHRLNWNPPPMQSDFSAYCRSFEDWLMNLI